MDAHKAIITIGREYGSGGHEIGMALAQQLSIPFYDREILTLAAKASGICEALFETHDEKTLPSYLFAPMPDLGALSQVGIPADLPLNHRIFLAQFDAVTKVAMEGPCVIVGRCSNYVLRGRPNVVNVFIYGDPAVRAARIMALTKLTREQAKDCVRKIDKQRQGYYNFFADGNWGHRSNYDLMINSSNLNLQGAVDSVIAYVKGRVLPVDE